MGKDIQFLITQYKHNINFNTQLKKFNRYLPAMTNYFNYISWHNLWMGVSEIRIELL